MNNSRFIAVFIGLAMAYVGYNGDKPSPPSPSPVDKIIVEIKATPIDDYLPLTDPIYLSISQPIIDNLKNNPSDALKVARAFKGWSNLLARSTKITTTEKFSFAMKESNAILFENYLSRRYGGVLENALHAVQIEAFKRKGLANDAGLLSASWSNEARTAAIETCETVASAAFEAFRRSQTP